MLMGNRWPGGRFLLRYPHPPPFPPQSRLHWSAAGVCSLPIHPLCNDWTGESAEGVLETPWRPEPMRKLGASDTGTRSDATPVDMSRDSSSRRSGSTLTQGVTVRPGGGLLARVWRWMRACAEIREGYVPIPSRPGRRSHASHAEKPRKQVLRKKAG